MNNDLEQFSEERLKKMTIGHIYPTTIEMAALARISLAAKQAKPVGYVLCNHGNPDIDFVFADEDSAIGTSEHLNDDADGRDEWTVMPFYTTPQPAHTEQVIPEGWKLVPIEPTEAMKKSYYESSLAPISKLSVTGYRAMLAAAPKPESE